MATKVSISDIQKLDDLRADISRHHETITDSLKNVAPTVHRALDEVGRRVIHWERMVQTWQREAQSLQGQLQACQSRNRDDPRVCGQIAERLRQAQQMVTTAQTSLAQANGCFQRLQAAWGEYEGQKARAEMRLRESSDAATRVLLRTASRARAVHEEGASDWMGGLDAALAELLGTGGRPHAASSGEFGREGFPNVEGLEGGTRRGGVLERG